MRTVSIFRNNRNQAIRLPKDLEFPGVTELSIEREGDAIVLRTTALLEKRVCMRCAAMSSRSTAF